MSWHTPGEWAVWARKGGELNVGPSHNCTVAAIYDPPVGDHQANARLIAAAPELLAALEEMVRWHAKRETASMCVSGGEGLLPIEAQDDEVQQAMRAITKATQP